MHRRISILRTVQLLLVLAAVLAPASLVDRAARAQVRIPAEAIESDLQIESLLARGQQLERQQRWGEALAYYEEALHRHPGRRELKERLTLARTHFDLARRYSDGSFTASVGMLDQSKALDVYSEVLLKINTYYVHTPDWRQLLRRGTEALDVALGDPSFTKRHLSGVSAERIDAFRRGLHRAMDWRAARSPKEARDAVAEAAHLAHQELGIPPTAVILEYACGAAASLDPYSTYLTGAQLEDLYSQIEGNFVGLGIELKADADSLLIVSVIEGSPAGRAHIHAGDHFIEVNGQSTRDISTDKAADMLKGGQGTPVDVTVQSADGGARRVRMFRERVDVPSVEDGRIVDRDAGVAYFRLSSFQKTTSREVDAALWDLHRKGMRSLIVDVRGNPGGLLTASVEVADKFVTDGTIVSTRGRSPREDFDYRAHRVGTWGLPLVVLIDRDTASAAEIFAGAILDHHRGRIVGQRSYGKGSVQGIFSLGATDAGVRLTTAKFYAPSGRAISDFGVPPDLPVRVAAKPVTGATPGDVTPEAVAGGSVAGPGAAAAPGPAGEDAVLSAAVETLRRQAGRRISAR